MPQKPQNAISQTAIKKYKQFRSVRNAQLKLKSKKQTRNYYTLLWFKSLKLNNKNIHNNTSLLFL